MRTYRILKRTLDLLVSLVILGITAPLLVIVTIVSSIIYHGNPLFIQKRIGQHCREFRLFKYRTMLDIDDENGIPLPDSQRLNAYGKFLRKTSIDELPQLINIFRGELSIVGPRPLLPEYLELYSKEELTRHDALPGITGWAQINGRNATSWKKRFEYDLWYVKNRNIWLDLFIMIRTVPAIVLGKGIRQEGQATMERFQGHK